MHSKADQIYAQQQGQVSEFRFDEQVADVFPDMIKRSVPGYERMIHTIGELAARVVQPRSNVYDLGCSLGAASLAMRRRIQAPEVQIVALDMSEAMVERCTRHMANYRSEVPVQVERADVCDYPLENASMVVLNFTLQFIEPEKRDALISNIYQALKPDGVLVLSEKLVFDDERLQHYLTELHYQFKRDNGYSELEISQKRSALENVLRPDTSAQHIERLQHAGFRHAGLWYQCFQFASFIAIK